ncbi:hypothetical protein CSKR_202081 [Clonorchis sinensis]|uniref:Uncharacterized protein n=1 Tax=Clonorchis sinensis TaxID=79923 RepID=A0A8T1LWF3_CLOSI|nr:hypothetical protein CSKR_202081 [Clonorchis sinensis]
MVISAICSSTSDFSPSFRGFSSISPSSCVTHRSAGKIVIISSAANHFRIIRSLVVCVCVANSALINLYRLHSIFQKCENTLPFQRNLGYCFGALFQPYLNTLLNEVA